MPNKPFKVNDKSALICANCGAYYPCPCDVWAGYYCTGCEEYYPSDIFDIDVPEPPCGCGLLDSK